MHRLRNILLTGILCFSAFNLPAMAVNSTNLTGYKGVTWGDSPNTVKRKLSRHFRYKWALDDGTLVFVGNIAGYRHNRIFTNFKKNKAYEVFVSFDSQDGKNTYEIYNDIKDKMTQVYGEPSSVDHEYSLGASDEELLQNTQDYNVLSGKIRLSTRWDFKDGNRILVSTVNSNDGRLWTCLSYYSPNLEEQLDASALNDLR